MNSNDELKASCLLIETLIREVQSLPARIAHAVAVKFEEEQEERRVEAAKERVS